MVAAHESGLTPDKIVREYTTLEGPADVYAALLYYHDHKDEIAADLAEEGRLEAEAERRAQITPRPWPWL